jgi:hypothetical protein
MPAIHHPFDRGTLIHLRLIFSVFLLPVYIFGLSETQVLSPFNTLLMFFILHLLIYPASNLYNSFWDKDKGSIGGIKNPPPASHNLYTASIILDVSGLLLAMFIHPLFSICLLPYIGASKLYSWSLTRLKKYAIAGWFTVIIFQGGYTFFLVSFFSRPIIDNSWFNLQNLMAMLISSLLIGAYYPLTQIYQHEEDAARGDHTLSYKLGITGTFLFSASVFAIAISIIVFYFNRFYTTKHLICFLSFLLPVLGYFLIWFLKCLKDPKKADYDHAMRMTTISSVCLIIAFTVLFFLNH